jgi:NAD(P)-dependent dehydrogenase (short-subunit alcohol dehydrogenase family)
MMAVNLDGVFLTVKHAARAMIGAGNGGSIITMASVTGLAGTPLTGHYAAAKAGVINLTKTAALELRPASVRIN